MLDVRSSVSVRTSLRVHTGVLVSPICSAVSTFERLVRNIRPERNIDEYIAGVRLRNRYTRGGMRSYNIFRNKTVKSDAVQLPGIMHCLGTLKQVWLYQRRYKALGAKNIARRT